MYKIETHKAIVSDIFKKQFELHNIDKEIKIIIQKKGTSIGVMPYGKVVKVAIEINFIEGITRQELEAVIAHEMYHILHNKVSLFVCMPTNILLKLSAIATVGLAYYNFAFIRDSSVLDIYFIISSITYLSTILISMLLNYVKRKEELKADIYSAFLMGDCNNTITALQKHPYVSDSLKSPLVSILYYGMLIGEHPTEKERIQNLKNNFTLGDS